MVQARSASITGRADHSHPSYRLSFRRHPMTYAVIGSGAIGGAPAKQSPRNNINAVITNRRGPASLENAFGPIVSATEVTHAVDAEVIILAVPFEAVADVARLRSDWSGKVVVDATNAIEFPAFKPQDLGGRPSTQVVR